MDVNLHPTHLHIVLLYREQGKRYRYSDVIPGTMRLRQSARGKSPSACSRFCRRAIALEPSARAWNQTWHVIEITTMIWR
jgi:hypothetical protein